MATWSSIRHKLENEYLAESLRGHVQYFATSYSKCPDHEGRSSIRFDGKEILSGSYYNQWVKTNQFPHDEKYERRMHLEHPFMDDVAMDLGLFDQRCFYQAFNIFDNQSIEESLQSENMLIRIFAILDRRVGKRRIKILNEAMGEQSKAVQAFILIRSKAEKIIQS